jgi:hypothetical protein
MLEPSRTTGLRLHSMAFAQPLHVRDAIVRHAQPIPRNNVIPLPLRHVLLQITLPHESEVESRAQLEALFHSPVGVYVAGTKVVHDEVVVHFDIAPEDLDFTMHTVIVTLPEAMIGPVRRRVKTNAH